MRDLLKACIYGELPEKKKKTERDLGLVSKSIVNQLWSQVPLLPTQFSSLQYQMYGWNYSSQPVNVVQSFQTCKKLYSTFFSL